MKNLEGLSRDKVESRGVGEVESSQLSQARELSVAENLRFISVNKLIQNVSFKPTEKLALEMRFGTCPVNKLLKILKC